MKTTPKQKTGSPEFVAWIKKIPVGEFPGIKERIITECKITDQVFKHWKSGNSKVPPLAQDKIILIAGRNIFSNDYGTDTKTPET